MTQNLATKIANASISMGAFATDKRNKDQDYGYISADQVLSRAGRAMAEQGLIIAPTITAESTEQINYESYGKKKSRFDSVVEMDMVITDGEKEMTQHWIGRGADYSTPDKAMYKAITSGHKYFLMKLLNIGVGNEDSEHDSTETATNGAQRTQTAKPAQHTNGNGNGAQAQPTPATDRYEDDGKGHTHVPDENDNPFDDVSNSVRTNYHELGTALHGKNWDKIRHEQVKAISKGERESSTELTEAEMKRLTGLMAAKLAKLNQPDNRRVAA